MNRGRPTTPLADRFWSKVIRGDEWAATINEGGYGTIRPDPTSKSRALAHRISWELHFGAIPDGMFVCHHCDNPRCVRPDHLFMGTPADNSADMSRKSRVAHGSRAGISKLKEADVTAIVAALGAGEVQDAIARRYGVSQGLIAHINNGRAWRRVTGRRSTP